LLFVIHALDKPDGSVRRQKAYPAHHAFLADAAKWGISIVMSGPLTADDGTTPIGSHFVIEAPDRKAADAFHHADPFFMADVWEKATITAFIKKKG
jgi:uncharacterized protein YciI